MLLYRKQIRYRKRKGAVLILSMIFLCVFAAWAVSIGSISGVSVQLSDNHRKANGARASAESGLEVVRYLLAEVTVPASVAPADRLADIATTLQSKLNAAGMTNVTPTYGSSEINIQNVALSSQTGQSFSAAIRQTGPDTLQGDVTGVNRQITRTIRTNFDLVESPNPLFGFGIATRGPISLTGNAKLRGLNSTSEASVYIESLNENEALSLTGNSEIAGDAGIVNPDAYATLIGNSRIGGESGQAAIDNHVSVVDAIEFPIPDVSTFAQYVQNTIDPETTTSGNLTFQNVKILAYVNPTFNGNITFNGIIFIESPNMVVFSGNTTITGLIVCDGDPEMPGQSDSLTFQGNFFSYDVSNLPETTGFEELREQTGSFLLAPGFRTAFGGNFHTINGGIAADSVSFSGNAGGTIKGSIINYSDDSMSLTGNTTINFDLSGSEDSPAGFEADAAVQFDAGSYSEIVL